MVQDVKPGGVFMINCQWSDEELAHHLNADAKKYIAENNIQLYTINAIEKAIEIGMGSVPTRSYSLHSSNLQTLCRSIRQ